MDLQIIKIANDTVSKGANKFVGAHIPEDLDVQMTLLSISEGVSRSTLIRKMILEELAPYDLVKSVAKRLYNLYQMKAERWSDFDLRTFKVMTTSELRRKGLDKSLLDQIYKEFDKLNK